VCVYFVAVAIGDDLYGTVPIGAADIDSCIPVTLQGFRVGMAHAIEVAAGKYHCAGVDRIDKNLGIGKSATVVRSL